MVKISRNNSQADSAINKKLDRLEKLVIAAIKPKETVRAKQDGCLMLLAPVILEMDFFLARSVQNGGNFRSERGRREAEHL